MIAALTKAQTDGQLAERLTFYSKPKPLLIDELGYLPFERRSAHVFFQLVARRYERGSTLIATNQLVTQWGTVFGDGAGRGDPRSPPASQLHAAGAGRELSVAAEEEGRAARPEPAPRGVTAPAVRPVVLGGGTDRPRLRAPGPTAENDTDHRQVS